MLGLKEEVKNIIKKAIKADQLTYTDLSLFDRRTLVAHLLSKSEQDLIDADGAYLLQNAIANIILKNADNSSLCHLLQTIHTVFLSGGKHAFYAEAIQALLSDQWDEDNRRSNEHVEHDTMQRIRDLRLDQNRPY